MHVTAVTPTTESRRPMLDSLLKCFSYQTYRGAELLILEEAGAPLDRTWPTGVRYVWMPDHKLSTGAKRNLINSMAEPGVIIHFDSDDWYHPERIQRQLTLLETSGQQVVGIHDLLYHRTTDNTLWQYRFQGCKPYAVGVSLCYYRDWWWAHPFPDKVFGEDVDFWSKAHSARVMASLGAEQGYPAIHIIVARAHGANTYSPAWGREPFTSASREMFPELFLQEAGL